MPESNATDSTPSGQARAMLIGAAATAATVHRERWAVIVGISKYQDASLNLKYAHRDAEELYKLITTPRGGGFDEERIVKLIDEEATTESLRKALRTFLKKPAREDIVLIYLACHGAFDPDRPQNVYLITHDTDPDDIAGTAYPMENIYTALQPHNLYSERVVLIADTCHSAAVGRIAGLRNMGEKAVANRYLQELSAAKEGLAVLTSSETNETSREGQEWGGGHGVFTYHLLQGLRGKAENKNGLVTVGNLFDYVREQVRESTGNQQHPVIGSSQYDRALPLAITGDISANDHFALGRHLLRLGWQLDDPKRFVAADRQLGEAMRLAGEFGEALPEAHLLQGQARLAAGQPESALAALEIAAKELEGDLGAEALFWQVMALQDAKELTAAADVVDLFLRDHAADWRAPFLKRVRSNERGTKRALLIGINNYNETNLRIGGAVNDMDMAESVLRKKFGFHQENITRCQDQDATRQGIVEALKKMSDITGEEDSLVIWYSGWANGDEEEKTFLFPVDYQIAAGKNGIDAEELHDLVQAIPAYSKTVVLDTNASQKLIDLARRDQSYDLYLAADRVGKLAMEKRFENKAHGALSFALLSTLKDSSDASLSEIERSVKAILAERGLDQNPLFISCGQWTFIEPSSLRLLLLDACQFALRRHYEALTLDDIRSTEKRFAVIGKPVYPPFYQSLGRAYLAKKSYKEAQSVLQAATQQAKETGYRDEELPLTLAIAQLRQQRYVGATDSLHAYQELAGDQTQGVGEAISILERLPYSEPRALLVGVSRQGHPDIPAASGAKADVVDLTDLLTKYLNVKKSNITVLIDNMATRENILRQFDFLVAASNEKPTLFFFAGNGSFTDDGRPTILPFDARNAPIPNDILLSDLAHRANGTRSNLISIIDAGWEKGTELPWRIETNSRFATPDRRPAPRERAILVSGKKAVEKAPDWSPDAEWLQARQAVIQAMTELQIGRTSLYPASFQAIFDKEHVPPGVTEMEAEFPSPLYGNTVPPAVRGALTSTFIRSSIASIQKRERPGVQLQVSGNAGINRAHDIDAMESMPRFQVLEEELQPLMKWLQPFLIGAIPEERLFTNVVQEERAQVLIYARMFEDPLRETATLLERMIERRNGDDPEGWLNLGIVRSALAEYYGSIEALQKAKDLGDTGPASLLHDASYYLGRVSLAASRSEKDEGERKAHLDRAIIELREAKDGDRENIPAYYYLGLAIRTRVEQEQLVEAQDVWQTYLDRGAPLGHTDEVKAFLGRSRGTGSGWEINPGTGDGTGTGPG